jgi:hypothetical protein
LNRRPTRRSDFVHLCGGNPAAGWRVAGPWTFRSSTLAFAALAGWLAALTGSGEVAAVPNTALATTGLVVVGAIWAGTWIAWGLLVWSRRRRRQP